MTAQLTESVAVGPFSVLDLPGEHVPSSVVRMARRQPGKPTVVFSLHVGGLNEWRNERYVRAMSAGDVTCADGAAVVLLARLAGGTRCGRAPTTDVGWQIVEALSRDLQRPARVALLGGPEGLAVKASERLQSGSPCEVVFAASGYQADWRATFDQVRNARPDLTFVGLGMPLEAEVVSANRDSLPDGLVVTCGGWFGFLAGDESRAPRILQKLGLEWTWRMAQSPIRLAPRYFTGLGTFLRLAGRIIRQRLA